MTWKDFKNSNLYDVMIKLEKEEDINKVIQQEFNLQMNFNLDSHIYFILFYLTLRYVLHP